ncbi:Hsp70 protein [Actinopolyspora xinjiangensis]|uniref:Hsp70 protein n=1 Tax=Actinopolyspora xinjiangensis TaxID=405564 RepID=A0A1H0WRW9_9ACTN|nr:Hsp70 family protein [Actinopolyspora xinjiangensis]SDP93420.1 Hsp70 protein [Actinopolyspora xinjiangensis]
MPYVLGVHLGATSTSAAVVVRDGGQWAPPAPFPLGSARAEVPTALGRLPDGTRLAGEAAASRAAESPEWVCTDFVTEVGTDTPLLLGGEFVPPHRLAASMVEWVADQVANRYGYPAEHIAVSHGACWGTHRTHRLHRALAELGLTDVTLLPEPLAVATDYVSRQPVSPGRSIAVGNVGGSGADATVLRRGESRWGEGSVRGPGAELELRGVTVSGSRPAGRELDDLVLEQLRAELGEPLAELDPFEARHRAAAAHLRAECTRVREELSTRESAAANVVLPSFSGEVPLARLRYEELARPHLELLPEKLAQAVQSASLVPDDLEAVVLAGGPTRTPLLRRLVRERLHERSPAAEGAGIAVRVDGSPELVAARGAAYCAVDVLSAATDRAAARAETSVLVRVDDSVAEAEHVQHYDYDPMNEQAVEAPVDAADRSARPPRPPVEVEPMHIEPPPKRKAVKIVKLSLAAILIIFGLVMTFVQGFGGQQPEQPGVLRQVGN